MSELNKKMRVAKPGYTGKPLVTNNIKLEELLPNDLKVKRGESNVRTKDKTPHR